jgi:uncharacterized protein
MLPAIVYNLVCSKPSSLQMPISSPCTSVCRMNSATQLCEGCLRNIDEIIAWGSQSDDWKRSVWALIAKRKESLANLAGSTPVRHDR